MVEVAPVNLMARRVRIALPIGTRKIPDIGHGDLHCFEPPQGRRSCQHRLALAASFIRATRQRGVGVPSSRSLAKASREAPQLYVVAALYRVRTNEVAAYAR